MLTRFVALAACLMLLSLDVTARSEAGAKLQTESGACDALRATAIASTLSVPTPVTSLQKARMRSSSAIRNGLGNSRLSIP